jgi:hypothetical protein
MNPDNSTNDITYASKLWRWIVAILLIAYGVSGSYYNSLYLGNRKGFILSGTGAWIACTGLICISVSLLAQVLYPKKNPINTTSGKSTFSGLAFNVGIALCLAGLVWYLVSLAHWI